MLKFILMFGIFITPTWATGDNDATLEQAKQNMNAGHYQQALKQLNQLVKENENSYEAWFLLGVSHVHEQQYSPAVEAFRHVIDLRPNLAEPHNNLAAVYNNLGDTKAAVKELEIALEKRPNYVVAEENLADLYVKLALQHYRNSLKQGGNEAIELRYQRLLQVRNPSAKSTIKAEEKPQLKENKSTTAATTPIALNSSKDTTVTPSIAVNDPKDTTVTPSIAEDKSITGVLDALETWRKAWSDQNLEGYYSAYADDFDPRPKQASIDAWRIYKKRVITNKSFIDVQFEKVEVDIPASRDVAIVSLLQHFSSNTFSGDNRKQITMRYTSQGWKIVTEVSLP